MTDIYDQINHLRIDALTAAYEAGELGEAPLGTHLRAIGTLGPDDWTDVDIYGPTLGDPEADWSVTIDGDDRVMVWAAGDEVASAVVPGALTVRPATRLSGAQVAACRTAMGLTVVDLAAILTVGERTVRDWESGRDPLPHARREQLEAMAAEHGALVEEYVAAGRVLVQRDRDAAVRPRGWYLAAAGRAAQIAPTVTVEWA